VLCSQPKAKTGFSLFADEEEDDLFASLSKSASSSGNKVTDHHDYLNPDLVLHRGAAPIPIF